MRRLAATTPADVLNELANFIKKISENFHEWCLRVSRDVWMHSSVGVLSIHFLIMPSILVAGMMPSLWSKVLPARQHGWPERNVSLILA